MNRKRRNARKMAQRRIFKMLDSRLAQRKVIEADFMTLLKEVGHQVDSWLDEKALLFALRSPGLEAIQAKAIIDEVTLFTSHAKEALPELLVVTDL